MRMINPIASFRRSLAGMTAALALGAAPAAAQFPSHDMDARSLGAAYDFKLRGQNITSAEVGSNEVIHRVGLGYSPSPYVALRLFMGMDRFSVEEYKRQEFNGDYGFSPSVGFSLYTPAFLGMLRGAAGLDYMTLSSDNRRGVKYSGSVTNPFLGAVVSPTVFLDLSLGGRFHLVDGTIESAAGNTPFANGTEPRGYVTVTLKTPFERAYMALDLEASPEFGSDWANGPREASIGISFGAVLGWKGRTKAAPEKPAYFPALQEMKDMQDQMAEELQ